ncbi:ribosome-associated translation inhibitor RaiA [bacterium]|nr:ribosome-associated translation inhibitor RaiA [bacterium]
MRINITARRFKLNDELKDYAENEVMRLKKYYDDIIDTEIILGWEKKDRLAEINIKLNGTKLSAHERSEDIHKSIVLAVDKLERQVKKYKGRRHGFEHESLSSMDIISESTDENDD